jgi:hypothetical protein
MATNSREPMIYLNDPDWKPRENVTFAPGVVVLPEPPERDDLLWIAVDLDGTLSESLWLPSNPTPEIGLPIESAVKKVKAAVEAGYKIVVHTARPWTDYERIEWWLTKHGIPFKGIVCGKLLARHYIDDRNIDMNAERWY